MSICSYAYSPENRNTTTEEENTEENIAENDVELAAEAQEGSDSEVIPVEMDIPRGQVIPSQDHGAETQTVMDDLMMVKTKFALKRKSSSKKDTPKKKKTVDEIIKEQDPKDDMLSIMGLIIVMWTDDFILTADFVKGLCENEYFTTFTERSMTMDESDWILDTYIEVLPEASCVLLTTTTTSTSSMIARTPTLVVDVDSPSTSKSAHTSEGGILDELFPHSNSVSNTGSISQSISKRDGDIFAT